MTSNDKQAFWQSHITAWQKSGSSQKAYCQQHELSLATFYHWKQKLTPVETKSSKLISVRMVPPSATVQVRLSCGVELNVPVSSLEEVLPIVARVAQGPL